MKEVITRGLAVVGAAALLVVGFDGVTYAATGSSLILGRSNSAGGVTTISRTTAGPVLSLKTTTSTAAPFSVNGKGQVANLNASLLGGNTAAQLLAKSAPTSLVFQDTATSRTSDVSYNSFTVPAGTWLITFNANLVLNNGGTPASPSNPNQISCWLYDGSVDWGQGAWIDISPAWYASPTFTRVATFSTSKTITLNCQTARGTGWTVLGDGYGPTVAFTKIGASTTTALAVS